jgi:Ala-tRNA(Pro) deacylase
MDHQISGCISGAVPPFGSVFNIPTYMDLSLRTVDSIDFNAGLRTDSLRMSQKDYEAAEQPTVGDFSS